MPAGSEAKEKGVRVRNVGLPVSSSAPPAVVRLVPGDPVSAWAEAVCQAGWPEGVLVPAVPDGSAICLHESCLDCDEVLDLPEKAVFLPTWQPSDGCGFDIAALLARNASLTAELEQCRAWKSLYEAELRKSHARLERGAQVLRASEAALEGKVHSGEQQRRWQQRRRGGLDKSSPEEEEEEEEEEKVSSTAPGNPLPTLAGYQSKRESKKAAKWGRNARSNKQLDVSDFLLPH